MKDAHHELDSVVRDAYRMGRKVDTLAFLLAPNEELAEKEAHGTPIDGSGLPQVINNRSAFIIQYRRLRQDGLEHRSQYATGQDNAVSKAGRRWALSLPTPIPLSVPSPSAKVYRQTGRCSRLMCEGTTGQGGEVCLPGDGRKRGPGLLRPDPLVGECALPPLDYLSLK